MMTGFAQSPDTETSAAPKMAPGPTGRTSMLQTVFSAINGYCGSIVAIGFVRAWLSFQTGIVNAYETAIVPNELLLGRPFAIIVACLALCFVSFKNHFVRHRRALCLGIGVSSSICYGVALALGSDAKPLSIVLSLYLLGTFCLMLRIWCIDNCSDGLRTILIRLALSFVVQYFLYSIVFLVPPVAQKTIAVITPLIIMAFLGSRPRPTMDLRFGEAHDRARTPGAKVSFSETCILAVVVGTCCASHGLLFSFSTTVSAVWLLGSLALALIILGAISVLRGTSLFRGFVCISLLTQCISVVLTLLFPQHIDWVSLAKSMSYAVSMMLTFSVGCYFGSMRVHDNDAGMYAMRWVTLYFVAFYVANLGVRFLNLENEVTPLVIVLLCLMLSAVLMLVKNWPFLAAGTTSEDALQRSDPDFEVLSRQLSEQAGLTNRECEVLAMLLAGNSVKEMADLSSVSINTIRSQVQSIYRKLGVHNRDELPHIPR